MQTSCQVLEESLTMFASNFMIFEIAAIKKMYTKEVLNIEVCNFLTLVCKVKAL